jgi:ribosomal protein S18 acetylase RimI-like enzyme
VEAGDVVACRLEAEPKNERAIKLYKSIGYKEFDYVQMSKKIK